jgi:hypothetical protein
MGAVALPVAPPVIRPTLLLASLALVACGPSRTAADANGRVCDLVGTDTGAAALQALYAERHAPLVIAGSGVYACPCTAQRLGGAVEKSSVGGASESARVAGATEATRVNGAEEQSNLGGGREHEAVSGGAEAERVGGATELLTCSVRSSCKGVRLSTKKDVAIFDDRGLVPGRKGCVSE